jgi:GNAT superfamily N-acetyltransferase
MQFRVLGWDNVAFRLDHRQFAYAGKFVIENGKAAALEPDAPPFSAQPGPREGPVEAFLGAVSFDPDRTDESVLRLRYITVRSDRRGEGIGPRLAAFVAARADARGYDRVRIAVNNPFAFEAVYKAGFRYTGRTTGIAELLCERPAGPLPDEHVGSRSTDRYRAGFARYAERELAAAERAFCERAEDRGPPPVIDLS